MCVLLVEDDFLIRCVMAESLANAGFSVIEAADGHQALEVIAMPPEPLTAVVTDYHMPGSLDGSHVAAAIRSRWPAMPVVIATGRPDVFEPRWADAGYGLLIKPYTPGELIALLRTMLKDS